MSTALSRRVIAGVSVVALGLGSAACSNADEKASKATEVAGSAVAKATDAAGDAAAKATDAAGKAADAAGSAAADATDAVGDAVSGAKEAVTDAATKEITLADGTTESVPEDLATAIANDSDLTGQSATSVEKGDNYYIAVLENGDNIVYTAETGAVPVIGRILDTWLENGGAQAKVGFPTAPERQDGDQYTQSFTNGVIDWDGASETADIQPR